MCALKSVIPVVFIGISDANVVRRILMDTATLASNSVRRQFIIVCGMFHQQRSWSSIRLRSSTEQRKSGGASYGTRGLKPPVFTKAPQIFFLLRAINRLKWNKLKLKWCTTSWLHFHDFFFWFNTWKNRLNRSLERPEIKPSNCKKRFAVGVHLEPLGAYSALNKKLSWCWQQARRV